MGARAITFKRIVDVLLGALAQAVPDRIYAASAGVVNVMYVGGYDPAKQARYVGFVGVPHGVELPVGRMFSRNVGLAGGMAPVRAYLPELLDLTMKGAINPGLVFDMTLPLDEVAEGYRAMDERRAIKVLLQP